jgi:hypothetical protein
MKLDLSLPTLLGLKHSQVHYNITNISLLVVALSSQVCYHLCKKKTNAKHFFLLVFKFSFDCAYFKDGAGLFLFDYQFANFLPFQIPTRIYFRFFFHILFCHNNFIHVNVTSYI